jgi:hypothetical protein
MIRCGKGYLYTGKDPWNYWDRIDKKKEEKQKKSGKLQITNVFIP